MQVGEVTEGTRLKIHERGTLVADVPNRALTDEAPVYHRPMAGAVVAARASQELSLDEPRRRRRRRRPRSIG